MSRDPQSETPNDDPDQRLGELFDGISELRSKCHVQTAMRMTLEARRLAKAERRLIGYLHANFFVMNLSQDLFEPDAGRDAAMENIALLESAERARAFQADYDESNYERTVQWMSACSYDNLATAIGMANGYNTSGMQACIADGIAVCRRTGKTECVACFREYATNVHRSADDLEMAMHHARTNVTTPPTENQDRRFVGARDLGELLLLNGQLEPAWEAATQAMQLADTYHTPTRAKRMTAVLMRQIGHLAGRDEWVKAGQAVSDRSPKGEDPVQDCRDDVTEALAEACRGDVPAAITRLTPWDAQLSDKKCWHWWFEVRLNLVALHRFAGQADRAAALAKPLEKRAKETQDFLTLRRLANTLSDDTKPAPFPTAAPLSSGPFATASAAATAQASPQTSASPASAPAAPAKRPAVEDEPGPLRPVLDGLAEQIGSILQAAAESESAPDFSPLIEQILAIDPKQVTHFDDAGRLLHMLTFLLHGDLPHERIWAWSRAAAANHPNHGKVIAIQAQLADMLRGAPDSPLADKINPTDLEAMYRKSMELEPSWPGGFRRAGQFYLGQGNDAEAERCLARAFRLDRSDEDVASQLSDVYAATDRRADALEVLDMCVREGTESAELLFKAGTCAASIERHASAVTYLDRLEEIEAGRPWVQYYRASSLLALGLPEDALQAAEAEAKRIERPDALHIHSLQAAAAAQLDKPDDARRHLEACLKIPLSSIEDLTGAGITSCHERMWSAASKLPANDVLRQRVTERLLQSGLTPEALWDDLRAQTPQTVQNLSHYVVDVRQPLGANWAKSPACPPGAQEWKAYIIRYGVLARSEDEARKTVLRWQSSGAAEKAEVLDVQAAGGPYTDRPGVTWRTNPVDADEAGAG